MDQQIGMDRDLTSSQRNIHHSAVAFDVGDSSIEDTRVVGSFSPMIEQSEEMRSPHELHTGIFLIGIVDG